MTTPEEEARKKSAEAKAKEPEKSNAPSNDGLSVIGQLLGDGKNFAVDALSGIHSGDKVLSSITPQLAAQYQLGKELQEQISSGAVKQSQLSASEQKNLEAFNSVRKSISQVPLYDRDSLTRYVEKGIQQKAKAAPQDASQPTVAKDGTSHKAPGKQAEHQVPKDGSDPKRSAAHPSQTVRKDVPGPTTTGVNADTKTASQKPSQAIRPQDLTAVRPHDRSEPRPQERVEVRPQDRSGTRSLESRTSVPRPQSDSSLANSQASVQTEGQRNSLVSNNKEAKSSELGAQRAGDYAQSGHAESHSPQKVGEVASKSTNHSPADATAQAFKVSRAESYVNKTFREGSSAISAFERRTGYDARVHQESKLNLYGRNFESQTTTQSQAREIGRVDGVIGRAENQEQKLIRVSESLRNSSAQRDAVASISPYIQRSFENMRRIFDERTSIVDVLNKESRTTVPKDIRSTGSPETLDVLRHPPGAERRLSLSEIRNSLSEQRVQQIVRTSEERFPAGLRWQNAIRQADSSAPSGKGRAPEAPGTNLSVRAVDRGAGSASIQPGMPGEISQSKAGQSASETAKVLSFNGRVTDRYITGAEIALAAIIAAAGAKRIRFDETIPGSDIGTQIPRVQKIQAFLPHKSVSDKGTSRMDVPKVDQRRPDIPFAENRAASTLRQNVSHQETFTSTFKPTEKRYVTGVEVALAAIIASCGTARIRQNFSESTAEDRMPAVSKDELNESVLSGEIRHEKSPNEKLQTMTDSSERKAKAQAWDEQDSPDDNVPGTLRYLQTHKFNRRTVLIGSNDTFVSIAERDLLNKDGNLGWLIADINLNRIKETYIDGKRIVEVRSRQTIDIPTADEIIVFMRHRKDEYKAENLVTIVVETQLDRELLNERLGVFVDREQKTPGLLPKYENL